MCDDKSEKMHFTRVVNLSPEVEGSIGAFIAASNLPAAAKVRLLATATSLDSHSSILSNGLQPRSMLKKVVDRGLTPPIKEFQQDATKRIFLGGFTSTTVYSNILRCAEQNPKWIKETKNYRFNCAFLFRPTAAILKYPLCAVVPEAMFQQNFMSDDKSIVKIFSEKFLGMPGAVRVPGAYKSAINFSLFPEYFIGSPHFDPLKIISSSMSSMSVNPLRFARGVTFFSLGSVIMFDAYKKFSPTE